MEVDFNVYLVFVEVAGNHLWVNQIGLTVLDDGLVVEPNVNVVGVQVGLGLSNCPIRRPQFGSSPKMAALTRLEPTMALATIWASSWL